MKGLFVMDSKKIKTSVLAVAMTASLVSGTVVNAVETGESYEMNISVNLAGEQKAISPYIYGMNEYGNTSNYKNVTVNAVRQGGNRYTGYNWETNYSNAGHDWLHSSDTNIGDDTDGAGYAVRQLSKRSNEYGVPYKMATLQMAGYVSADKAGSVKEDEVAPSTRWNKVEFRKDGELSLTPDLTDDTVYMDEYVNFIVETLGDASTATGIQGYSLDNEPVLWNDTHPLIHPEEVSNEELVSKSIELAKVVKEIDPKAEVFGPAFWGVLPCVIAGSDGSTFTDTQWEAVKSNYSWYLDYYLEQMADAEKECGTRLLDVIDVHYYAQDCSTDDAILQAARSLYDENYVENSWLGQSFSQYLPFLPAISESVDKYYPGTKIAVTEYNLANIADEKNTGKSVVSAIAETEALGAFADNGVYLATYWGTLPECPYVESAINLYTNYDGKGSNFGDTLVESSTEDISLSTAYAAIDSGDTSEVTVVVSNKDKTKTQKSVIDISGSDKDYKSAVVYAITQDSSEIRVIEVDNEVSGNKIEVELPPLSVAQVVISDELSDEKLYEAPDITVKEVVYNYSDLKMSDAGFPMLPLEDVEHIKEVIINTTATCNSGASWYCGGGALTFNNLVIESGEKVWGSKAFSYSAGTGDNTIKFDNVFTDSNLEEITATVADTYAEIQTWWASSEKDEKGADVSLTYNTITVVYEYDNSVTTETTETTAAEDTTMTTTETSDTTSVSESETTTSVSNDETTIGSTSVNLAATLLGDADCSGTVDLLDLTVANQHVVKIALLEGEGFANADVIADGDVQISDLTQIKKYLIKLIDKF